MKKNLILLFLLVAFSVKAQITGKPTNFSYGIKLKNATNDVNIDSIPVIDGNKEINSYITKTQFISQIGDSFYTKTESDNRYLQLTGGTITGTTLYDKTIADQESASVKTVVNREFVEDYVANFVPYVGATQDVDLGANSIKLGKEVTVANKGVHEVYLYDSNDVSIFTKQKSYWDGSSYVITANYGLGANSLLNNTGGNSNGFGSSALQNNSGLSSNGFGFYALRNNTGASSNGFGQQALQNNTGGNSNGFGHQALYSNSGANSNGFGSYALRNNTGASSNGFGYQALYSNSGASSNGFGFYALQTNTGASSNGFGYVALLNNTGSNSNGFGYQALVNNTGSNSNGFGNNALLNNTGSNSNGFGYQSLYNNSGASSNGFGGYSLFYNDGDSNTAIGNLSFSEFYADTLNPITFLGSAVDVANDTITINAHGLGYVGKIFNVRAVAPNFLGGLTSTTNNYRFEVVDANTLKSLTNITSKDDGLTYTFHKQITIENTTTVGANSQPTKSNQVVLGDTNVEEVLTYGVFKSNATIAEITDASHIPTVGYLNNKYVSKSGGTITGTTLYDKTIAEQESANIKTVVNREFVEDYVANNAPTPDLTGLVPYVGAINDVDLGNHSIKLGKEVTVANKGVHEVYLYDSNDVSIFTKQKSYWNGSSYVSTANYGLGANSLLNNTGSNSNGFGANSLQNNTGAFSNGFGNNALLNNTGLNSNGFGYQALRGNYGSSSNGFGNYALSNNTGSSSNGFGSSSLENNNGSASNGFGFYSLQNNTGSNSNGFGSNSLIFNDGDSNTSIGHLSFSEFYADTLNPITFLGTDVDVANNTITINAHGLGSVGKIFNVRAVAPNFLGGLTSIYNNYRFEVVDANTLKSLNNITSKDDGLTYTFHKQIAISNTTTIGANSQPTKSNQVVLGDTNVEEVLTYGVFKSEADYTEITDLKHVPNLEYLSNEYYTKTESDNNYLNKTTGGTITGTTIYDKTIAEQASANIKTVVNREFVEDYVGSISNAKLLSPILYSQLTPVGLPGQLAVITDAGIVTYRGVASGGGSNVALVMYDGTNWIYH